MMEKRLEYLKKHKIIVILVFLLVIFLNFVYFCGKIIK